MNSRRYSSHTVSQNTNKTTIISTVQYVKRKAEVCSGLPLQTTTINHRYLQADDLVIATISSVAL